MATEILASVESQLRKALPILSRASDGAVLALRANGQALTQEARTQLLARAVAREDVSLELDVLAFKQQAGVANRNFVRFRDGAVLALGASGAGKPFLADHNKWELDARLGTILDSVGKKLGDGDYEVRMTVQLTEPAAVEKALRGNMSSVSIGWNPTGPIECSIHGTEVWTECSCWPGTRLAEVTDAAGKKKFVRDRKGMAVAEWVYTAAELIECSAVNVPAVPAAGIEGVRAALSAAGLTDDQLAEMERSLGNSTRTDPVPQPVLITMPDPKPEQPAMTILSDAQYAHYLKLSPSEQPAFLAKSRGERDAELAAAIAADPIVHTTKDGLAIRKSDGDVALMLAKKADKDADAIAALAAETARVNELHAAQVLATRANAEIGHLAGTAPVRVALLRAVDGIADESTRTAVLESLRGADARMAELATPKGGNPGGDPQVLGAAEKIEALAVKYAAEHKVDLTTARALVYETPEGAALYAEMRSAKK